MKIKVKRRNFAFSEKTDNLLNKIKKETEYNFTLILKEAVELYAEKKGIKNED